MLFLSGCSSVSTVGRPSDYYSSGSHVNSKPLFQTTVILTKDQDIIRLLEHRLELPAKNRIAILKLSGDSYWRNYSSDFTQLTKSVAVNFIGKLRESPRVYDASFLPSMLVPEKRTMPHLRAAAALYQADLLLAYRTNCRTFTKRRFIDPNETRAYCAIEVLVMDVRTGIIPFTSLSSNEFSAKKEKSEINFSETIKKAELEAIGKSLEEAAVQLNTFLVGVGTM